MTAKERKLLNSMIKSIEVVAVPAREYAADFSSSKELTPPKMIATRLAADSEYRAGWEACRARVLSYLSGLQLPNARGD